MRYLRLYESFEEMLFLINQIDKTCKEYNITNYTINNDGTIDVDGSVNILFWQHLITKFPFKFNKVNGEFICNNNKLLSFEGSPVEVNGDFLCYNNRLTSLKGCPKIIRGSFNCQLNNIKSFEYFPSFIKIFFNCHDNPIWHVWKLFEDTTKIELFNDFDIFRDEDTNTPVIIMDRLNDFLLTIGKNPVKKVEKYKNI